MEFIGESRIRLAQKSLGVDFASKSESAMAELGKTLLHLWQTSKIDMFLETSKIILCEKIAGGSYVKCFSELKNLAIRHGYDIISLAKTTSKAPCLERNKKTVSKIDYHVVVGCGNLFKIGKGDDIRSAIDDAKSRWVDALVSSIVEYVEAGKMDEAARKTMDVLLSDETQEMSQLMKMGPGLSLIEEVNSSEVPMKAREALRKVSGIWYIIRRTRNSKKSSSNLGFKERGIKIEDLFLEIREKCILSNGLAAQCMWKGNEEAWHKDGGELLKRISEGIEKFGVVGLDSEGGGIWIQLSWLGVYGAEAIIMGPNFFPKDLVEVLHCKGVYILGVAVWEDLMFLLDDPMDCKSVDLSVLVSDLPSSNLNRPGMASIVLDATGVDLSHLKKSSIRYKGWDNKSLSDEKLLYAAMDVTLVFPILYKVLEHWRHRYSKGNLIEDKVLSWNSLLSVILDPLVNRRRVDGRNLESLKRDPLMQTVGLFRSIHVSEHVPTSRKKKGMHNLNWHSFV